MSLQLLSEDLRSHIRSGVAITSLAQCVEELVLNGIDARASMITVHVDTCNFFIKVTDNGGGITKGDLQLVGKRYVTSKCHTLSDLNELCCYGYRGEALASLSSICRQVEIISRHRFSNLTNYKSIQHGQAFPPVLSPSHQLSRSGTIVILSDIFHSLPVRRKSIQSEAMELDKIRHAMTAICLIHPTVSFSLYNLQNMKCLLQTQSTNSIPKTFSSLFGHELLPNLKQVQHSHMYFNIHGYISIEGHHNKCLQFIYVNKRLVCKTHIHSHVNAALSHSLITKSKISRQAETKTCTTIIGMSPQYSFPDKYGVFILNIQCPLSEYDICIEPAKTLVEFKEWEGVLNAVDNTVKKFLKQYNLLLGIHYFSSRNSSRNYGSFVGSNEEVTIGVQSQPVKRSPLSLLSPSLRDTNTPLSTSNITTPFCNSGKRKSCSKITEKLLRSKLICLPSDSSTPLTIDSQTVPISINQPFTSSSINQSYTPLSIASVDQSIAIDQSNAVSLFTEQYSEPLDPSPHVIVSDDTLSSVNSQSLLVHSKSTASCFNNTDWMTTNDTVTGSRLYINVATGNCQSTTPPTRSITIEETPNIGQCYGHHPLRAAPHLSYGYSPLCPRPKDVRQSIPNTSLDNTVSSVDISMDKGDVSNKWREDLSDWTNPAFKCGHEDILNIGTTSRCNSSQIKVHSMIHSHTFSPAMLTTAKVVGQVDNKFIACLLATQLKGDLLVLFDQHAVHERIRLEALKEELYESSSDTKRIPSMILDSPFVIQLDRNSRELAMTFIKQLETIGVKFKCKGGEAVFITTLPVVLMESPLAKEPSSLRRLAHDLIVKHIQTLKSVGKGTLIVPSLIQQILNSKACHGAIKFGDSLSLEQCSEMIHSLSQCKLPFQCAHGRPSLVPILDLPLLEKRFPTKHTATTKLNLSKLKYLS